jgi:hypothetical protein
VPPPPRKEKEKGEDQKITEGQFPRFSVGVGVIEPILKFAAAAAADDDDEVNFITNLTLSNTNKQKWKETVYSTSKYKYEGRLKSSLTGSSAPLLCRGRR